MGKAMGKAANKSTCPGTKQQEARDAKGRWKPGRSGNPAGPKPGASCRALLMAREWTESVGLPRLMEAAEGGDMDAIKLLVQLGMPRTKAVSIPTALPGGPDGVLAALEAGTIAPDEAKVVMDVHLGRAKIREVEELEQRLAALERAVQEKESDR